MRMLGGKVMMDRNAPPALCDTAQSGYDDTKALIARWQGKGRLDYVITPRFAITSTPEQLEASRALVREHPGSYIQTHLSENHDEISFTKSLYPQAPDYLGIYEHYGLLGDKTLLGHSIHHGTTRSARHGGNRLGGSLLPDLQPVPRFGPFRPRPPESVRRAYGGGDRCRWRHKFLHAAHYG